MPASSISRSSSNPALSRCGSRGCHPSAKLATTQCRPKRVEKRVGFLKSLLGDELTPLIQWHSQRPEHEQRRFLAMLESLYTANNANKARQKLRGTASTSSVDGSHFSACAQSLPPVKEDFTLSISRGIDHYARKAAHNSRRPLPGTASKNTLNEWLQSQGSRAPPDGARDLTRCASAPRISSGVGRGDSTIADDSCVSLPSKGDRPETPCASGSRHSGTDAGSDCGSGVGWGTRGGGSLVPRGSDRSSSASYSVYSGGFSSSPSATRSTVSTRYTSFSRATHTTEPDDLPGATYPRDFRWHKRGLRANFNSRYLPNYIQKESGGTFDLGYPEERRLASKYASDFSATGSRSQQSKSLYKDVIGSEQHDLVDSWLSSCDGQSRAHFGHVVTALRNFKVDKGSLTSYQSQYDLEYDKRFQEFKPARPFLSKEALNRSHVPLSPVFVPPKTAKSSETKTSTRNNE